MYWRYKDVPIGVCGGAKPAARLVTLAAAGWTGSGPYRLTVAVPDVRADERAQLVQIAPSAASRDAWEASGARCTGQGDGALTFETREKPDESLGVYVILQEVAV